MPWKREMEQDAVAIAFPDWSWCEDDIVDIEMEFDDGHDPTYGPGDPSYRLNVDVRRVAASPIGSVDRDWMTYCGEDVAVFWASLMRRGSER